MKENQRKNTRNKVWPGTEAIVSVKDLSKIHKLAKAETKAYVENLSGNGVFVTTKDPFAIQTVVNIKIDFEPGKLPPNVIHATGVVLRQEETGVAIKFQSIDTRQLGECIMARMNSRS